MNTRLVGKLGEDLAVKYLTKHKYKVIGRNFGCSYGEIDIIAWDGECIVFIEVKARKDDSFGLPREAVTYRKQQTIIKCANYWLYKNKIVDVSVRFDVIEILGTHITHLIDAFRS